ncbi:MAG: mandelate racemase/muconate lactonizing enzyme family protein [Caldilineaceae bacterium]|nr:mandelate racemase/muconate lactonizing enzyme family protein [Caldilineaceae bacterium]
MKITAIKTFIVDGGFRPWTFVKIETSEPGLIGWGDCTDWGSPGPVAATVERYAEWVIGRDPMQVESIWWDLATASARHTGGIAWKAMAGIDSALWDIRGKVLNAPVWQLLGGKMRDKLRLYWSHCGSIRARHAERLGLPPVETTDDLRRLAHEVMERGYTAIKTNLFALKDRPDAPPLLNRFTNHPGDAPPQIIRNAEAVVGAFREEFGPDVGIALDVAFTFKLGGAIKLAQALEPYDLMWLETETLDPQALRLIRESTRTTICTGESLFGAHQYRPYLELHAQDIIMPDLAWNGLTMGKKIADMAHAYDILVAPHNCHSPINTLVSAALCATIPNFFIQEFDVDDAPWRDEIMTHPFEIEAGYLKLPQRPGLGSDLIEEKLLKYPPVSYPGAR